MVVTGQQRDGTRHRSSADAGQDVELDRMEGRRPPRRHVSFVTAVLMAVALCFHSLLEVRMTNQRTGWADSAV
jgi:hypothetical protein